MRRNATQASKRRALQRPGSRLRRLAAGIVATNKLSLRWRLDCVALRAQWGHLGLEQGRRWTIREKWHVLWSSHCAWLASRIKRNRINRKTIGCRGRGRGRKKQRLNRNKGDGVETVSQP